MDILGWILFGFVIGLVVRVVLPSRSSLGLIGMTLLGMLGAVLGGWLGIAVGWYQSGDELSFLAATLGALLMIFSYQGFKMQREKKSTEHQAQREKKLEERRKRAA